jgi:predicted enzyme related to lactoylglutathione lyase
MPKSFEVSGPSFLGLYVRDLAAAADFYESKLGFKPDTEVNTWSVAVAFHSYPIPFAVIKAPPGMDLENMPRPQTVPAIWFKTANSQVVHDYLAAQGVTILRPITTGRFGRQFTFVDPEGYAINIYDRDTPPEDWSPQGR